MRHFNKVCVASIFILLGACSSNQNDYFGQYSNSMKDEEIILEMSKYNTYTLYWVHHLAADITEEELLSSGKISVEGNIVILGNDLLRYRINHDTLTLQGNSGAIISERRKIESPQKLYYSEGIYPNGKIKFSGSWCEGKKCGVWEFYDENGRVEATYNYANYN